MRLLSLRRVAGVLLAAGLLAGCSGGQSEASSAGPSVSVLLGTVGRPDHVVVVIEENKGYAEVIGNSTAPYLNGLAVQGALFDHSFAVAHPSQPNYFALFSGSTQGITNDYCRLAAVVADPAIFSLWGCWQAGEPAITSLFGDGASKDQVNAEWQQIVPHLDDVALYNLAKRTEPYGKQFLRAARSGKVLIDLYDLGTTLMTFTVADVVGDITSPTLVTSYEGDDLVKPPQDQGDLVYQRLRCAKQAYTFTAADGADQHCAPMAPQTRNQVVYDWLDGIL